MKAKKLPLTPENATFLINMSDEDIHNMALDVREQFITQGLFSKTKAETSMAASRRSVARQPIVAEKSGP